LESDSADASGHEYEAVPRFEAAAMMARALLPFNNRRWQSAGNRAGGISLFRGLGEAHGIHQNHPALPPCHDWLRHPA
ncbi:MAG TPA: hypothetical protein VFE34_14640, partial [Dongiaceae bacterium]|nr:hypothetical protein [Dongiaceae bacterium]